ncbi:MAG: hypothetical protein IKG30_07520 [Clostridiales bacterium]|jgi:hypothetical protein|nr:hypothetical protein [Clostridiales bacterium]
MKRSKKPLTFAAVVASIGALSLAVEGCVYGPPQETRETNVYGPPPPEVTATEEIDDTQPFKPSADPDETNEVCVYGPAPDTPVDKPEEGVYGPPPDVTVDGPEEDVYGPPEDFI